MGWRFNIVRQEMEAMSLQEKRRIQQWSNDLINTHHELRHDAEYISDRCLVQVQAWEIKSLDELVSLRLKLGKPVGQQQASMLAIFITTLYLQIHVIALNFVPGPTRYFLRPIWLSIRSKEAAALFHNIRFTAFLTHLFSEPSSPLALLHFGIVFLLVIRLAMMRLDHMFVVSVPEGVWMVVFSSAIVVMMVTDDHSSLYHQVLYTWRPLPPTQFGLKLID